MIADKQELGTNAKWGQLTWGKMELDGGKNCIKWHKIRLTSQITPGNVFIFKINIGNVCMSNNRIKHSLKISTGGVDM